MAARDARPEAEPLAVGPGAEEAPSLVRQVGLRVRGLRADRHLTLDQLAERSGVSRRMITMLEAGETNASIGTLDKLAAALGVELTALVASRPALPLAPAASETVDPLWEDGRGSSARLLVSDRRASTAELWQWRLVPGARYDADADPPGTEEILLVSTGQLEIEIGGERYRLGADGYLRLPTDRPYAYTNPGARPCRFIRVVVTPGAEP